MQSNYMTYLKERIQHWGNIERSAGKLMLPNEKALYLETA